MGNSEKQVSWWASRRAEAKFGEGSEADGWVAIYILQATYRLAVLAAVLEVPGLPNELQQAAPPSANPAPYCPWLPWRMFSTARKLEAAYGPQLETVLARSMCRVTNAHTMSSTEWDTAEHQLSLQHSAVEAMLDNFRAFSAALPALKAASAENSGGCSYKIIASLKISLLEGTGGEKNFKSSTKNDGFFTKTLEWAENELRVLHVDLQEIREAAKRVMTGPADAGVAEWFGKASTKAVGKVLELLAGAIFFFFASFFSSGTL
jgi:hypothetical protein